DAAEDDVVNPGRIDPRALDERAEDVCAEVRRVHSREAPLLSAGRRAHRADDVGLRAHGAGSSRASQSRSRGPKATKEGFSSASRVLYSRGAASRRQTGPPAAVITASAAAVDHSPLGTWTTPSEGAWPSMRAMFTVNSPLRERNSRVPSSGSTSQ